MPQPVEEMGGSQQGAAGCRIHCTVENKGLEVKPYWPIEQCLHDCVSCGVPFPSYSCNGREPRNEVLASVILTSLQVTTCSPGTSAMISDTTDITSASVYVYVSVCVCVMCVGVSVCGGGGGSKWK